MEWQPIETAPKGRFYAEKWFLSASPPLLLWDGLGATIGQYGYTERGKGRWRDWRGNVEPTHWMPLPAPPE